MFTFEAENLKSLKMLEVAHVGFSHIIPHLSKVELFLLLSQNLYSFFLQSNSFIVRKENKKVLIVTS